MDHPPNEPPTAPRPLATITEVAAFLRVSVPTLRVWRRIGYGPKGTLVGRRLRYEWSVVEAFARAGVAVASVSDGT